MVNFPKTKEPAEGSSRGLTHCMQPEKLQIYCNTNPMIVEHNSAKTRPKNKEPATGSERGLTDCMQANFGSVANRL